MRRHDATRRNPATFEQQVLWFEVFRNKNHFVLFSLILIYKINPRSTYTTGIFFLPEPAGFCTKLPHKQTGNASAFPENAAP